MSPLPYLPARDPRHRCAALALLRALIRSARLVRLPPALLLRQHAPSSASLHPASRNSLAVRNPIVKVIRKRFLSNRADTSPRLIYAAMTAGYRFLTVLTRAQEGPQCLDHALIITLLNAPAVADKRGEMRKESQRLWDIERRSVKQGRADKELYGEAYHNFIQGHEHLRQYEQPIELGIQSLYTRDETFSETKLARPQRLLDSKDQVYNQKMLRSPDKINIGHQPHIMARCKDEQKNATQQESGIQSEPRIPELDTQHIQQVKNPPNPRPPFLINTARPGQSPRYTLSFMPTLRSPRPTIATTSHGQPFLRFVKPQPKPLSSAIFRRNALWNKRVARILDIAQVDFPQADCEDAWDALVAAQMHKQLPASSPFVHDVNVQVCSEPTTTYCWSVQLSRFWLEYKMDLMWEDWVARGDALAQYLDQHYDKKYQQEQQQSASRHTMRQNRPLQGKPLAPVVRQRQNSVSRGQHLARPSSIIISPEVPIPALHGHTKGTRAGFSLNVDPKDPYICPSWAHLIHVKKGELLFLMRHFQQHTNQAHTFDTVF
ncbi:hypothetical protein CDD82_7067 [Ophiocordyceps australis]|uniref:Uncharacterized protein n=1 Tax=Ophiocordyceps australis TaxID=1399860 RepID=A0A2C5ZQG1_9HYPO|nr:hypothetical protein CDD82_7067 [Ophiocordyceps australis]